LRNIRAIAINASSVRGVTTSLKKHVDLARRIEEVVTWLPAEGDALDGSPKGWVK
jgi:hypothetical protein